MRINKTIILNVVFLIIFNLMLDQSFATENVANGNVANGKPEIKNNKSQLHEKLSQLTGSFLMKSGHYYHSQTTLLNKSLNLSENDTENEVLVKELVDCIDDKSLSESVFDNKKVTLGLMCYTALTQIVYYEPNTKSWAGFITPKSKSKDFQNAKKEWLKILKNKMHIYL